MNDLELAGAPLAWLWLLILTATLALPPFVRGLRRRGTGVFHRRSFLIQRAPQLATALAFSLVMVSFEVLEFAFGTGEPAFGKAFFDRYAAFLPIASLALVLPTAWASVLSWVGVTWSALGSVLLVSGLYALRESFSTDAELLADQQLHREGPYRFVLHPMYAGWVHLLLGSALTALSPIAALVVVALVAPLYVGRAKYEEALLRERFGLAFDGFAASRHYRRLIPLLAPVPN